MLNIDIKFKSGTWFFPVTFMSGLIKTIMVLVGCLMIEKLAGDLGGYFGGGNATKMKYEKAADLLDEYLDMETSEDFATLLETFSEDYTAVFGLAAE